MSICSDDLTLIYEKLRDRLPYFRDKSIFITGGTGFFGKWILSAIKNLNENYALNTSVVILSRNPNAFSNLMPELYHHEMFTFVRGDVSELTSDGLKYDLIIHAATDVSTSVANEDMLKTIMHGVERITEFANAAECKRLLFTSSGAAYGPQPRNMLGLAEDFLSNPLFNTNDVYALGKKQSEEYLKKNLCSELVIARCFAFSGPYLPLKGKYAFGNFINNVLNNEDIVIKGNGKTTRSYLYAADLVIWLLSILAEGKNGEVYNVGSSHAVSIKDLATEIAKNGCKFKVLNEIKGGDNIYYPNVDKVKNELGLFEYTPLDQAIKKTIDFYRTKMKDGYSNYE
jgi:dTDP-glucose 4,6-dehydratase